MLICACDKAQKDCDKFCPKGKKIKPDRVYYVPWKYEGPAFNMNDRK